MEILKDFGFAFLGLSAGYGTGYVSEYIGAMITAKLTPSTNANSDKTTLEKSLAQGVLLAQTGMPVRLMSAIGGYFLITNVFPILTNNPTASTFFAVGYMTITQQLFYDFFHDFILANFF